MVAAPRRRAPLVYLITDQGSSTEGRTLPAAVAAAMKAIRAADTGTGTRARGGVAVQLREKNLGGRALLALARELRQATAAPTGPGEGHGHPQAAGGPGHVRLFVNDRVDVALAGGADGVHLGGGSMSVADVHAIAPDLEIALSTHTLAEVAAAAADPRVSFVVFGPVFDTPSKRIFGPPRGLEKLREACLFPIPVVALGGVQADNIPACFRAGASGVACMSAVLSAGDPEAALSTFFRAIEST